MTEKQSYKLLNTFANSHSVSLGGNIKAEIGHTGTRLYPRDCEGMKCEDVIYLSDIIRGAQQFCYFLSRNKYNIVRRTNDRNKH